MQVGPSNSVWPVDSPTVRADVLAAAQALSVSFRHFILKQYHIMENAWGPGRLEKALQFLHADDMPHPIEKLEQGPHISWQCRCSAPTDPVLHGIQSPGTAFCHVCNTAAPKDAFDKDRENFFTPQSGALCLPRAMQNAHGTTADATLTDAAFETASKRVERQGSSECTPMCADGGSWHSTAVAHESLSKSHLVAAKEVPTHPMRQPSSTWVAPCGPCTPWVTPCTLCTLWVTPPYSVHPMGHPL